MPYRVKNISDKPFSFEGVNLQAGEVSGELTLDTYQILLALNYGTILMPVEDGEVAPEPEIPAIVDQELLDENPELKEAGVEVGSPVEVVDDPFTTSETQTVEVEVPAATVVAEPVVEAPKKRGRPRKNL